MGTSKIIMINTENYKAIENFVATIYSEDIYKFGGKSYYPQILKIISSVNLRSFKEENVICDNHTFISTAIGSNINAVARGLKLPRETSRRKIEELINLNWIIKKNSKLYVSQKWRIINQTHINLLIEKIKKLSKLIDKQLTHAA